MFEEKDIVFEKTSPKNKEQQNGILIRINNNSLLEDSVKKLKELKNSYEELKSYDVGLFEINVRTLALIESVIKLTALYYSYDIEFWRNKEYLIKELEKTFVYFHKEAKTLLTTWNNITNAKFKSIPHGIARLYRIFDSNKDSEDISIQRLISLFEFICRKFIVKNKSDYYENQFVYYRMGMSGWVDLKEDIKQYLINDNYLKTGTLYESPQLSLF